MESNDSFGASGADPGANQNDADEFSGSGSTQQPRSNFDFAGGATGEQQNIKDRAKGAVGAAGEKLADVGSGLRDKAGNVKEKLANALESGAERLRERSGSGTLVGATTAGTTPVQGDGRVAQLSDKVAGGMQASADWLRDADIEGMKTGIERQVKEHPGRTLLIAAGLGYLIGRAFKGDK
jgi:ElaB/YqjD/DUF883 family membrane-anchored ribosome-binding protein